MLKILLVYPQSPDTFWSFKHLLRFVSRRAAFPPVGLLTIAAMLPRAWQLKLVDLNVELLREEDLRWADYVMISAMLVHRASVEEVVARCGAMGKPIIAGGPLFTTGHEAFPDIPHFVLGEAEDILPEVIADMTVGRLKRFYEGPVRPDISRTPVPRLDLVRLENYITMAVQFSRGCPFDCEFCDIIVGFDSDREDIFKRQFDFIQRSGVATAMVGLLGVWHRGRAACWRLFWSTLLRRPRQFPHAIELAIMGHHFRRVASRL